MAFSSLRYKKFLMILFTLFSALFIVIALYFLSVWNKLSDIQSFSVKKDAIQYCIRFPSTDIPSSWWSSIYQKDKDFGSNQQDELIDFYFSTILLCGSELYNNGEQATLFIELVLKSEAHILIEKLIAFQSSPAYLKLATDEKTNIDDWIYILNFFTSS